MKRRSSSISNGLINKSREKTLAELKGLLFYKVPPKETTDKPKKTKISDLEEKNINVEMPANNDEDNRLDEDQKEIVDAIWDKDKMQYNYWDENLDINNSWAADQDEFDRNDELEQLQNEKLNYLQSEGINNDEDEDDKDVEDVKDNHDIEKIRNYKKSYEGVFNLMETISLFLQKTKQIKKKPDDKDDFLSVSKNSTKEKFSKDLKKFSISHNVNAEGLNNLLSILKEHVPEVN
jgi:hypothetical protein